MASVEFVCSNIGRVEFTPVHWNELVMMLLKWSLAEYMWSLPHILHSVQQIASDTESAAMVIVNITANASELEVPAIIVATSIVEELTAVAIDQPEVCHQFTSS